MFAILTGLCFSCHERGFYLRPFGSRTEPALVSKLHSFSMSFLFVGFQNFNLLSSVQTQVFIREKEYSEQQKTGVVHGETAVAMLIHLKALVSGVPDFRPRNWSHSFNDKRVSEKFTRLSISLPLSSRKMNGAQMGAGIRTQDWTRKTSRTLPFSLPSTRLGLHKNHSSVCA